MRVVYNIKQALQQIHRNRGMSIASMFAITAMLLILGFFFVITVNVNLFSEMVKSEYEEVEVFMQDKATTDDSQMVMNKLHKIDGVKDISFRNKEEAMNIMKKRWGENSYLLDNLEKNPLPDSVIVKVDSMKAAEKVKKSASGMENVESVKYYKGTVEKLTKITDGFQIGSIVIMIFLVVVSVVVVSNTIKLTVFAREKEIFIMKYVGASNWFIRGPFLVEGMIIGAVSSGFASLITYFVYRKITESVGIKIMTMLSTPMVPAGYIAGNLVIIFLAIGISIGASGSVISMRKFLDT